MLCALPCAHPCSTIRQQARIGSLAGSKRGIVPSHHSISTFVPKHRMTTQSSDVGMLTHLAALCFSIPQQPGPHRRVDCVKHEAHALERARRDRRLFILHIKCQAHGVLDVQAFPGCIKLVWIRWFQLSVVCTHSERMIGEACFSAASFIKQPLLNN